MKLKINSCIKNTIFLCIIAFSRILKMLNLKTHQTAQNQSSTIFWPGKHIKWLDIVSPYRLVTSHQQCTGNTTLDSRGVVHFKIARIHVRLDLKILFVLAKSGGTCFPNFCLLIVDTDCVVALRSLFSFLQPVLK